MGGLLSYGGNQTSVNMKGVVGLTAKAIVTRLSCNGYLELLGLAALFKTGIFLIFNVSLWLPSFFYYGNICSPIQIGGETKCQ